ncbi:methyltransferase domain-containing protein [Thermodesulfobacteriota bacterium]
MSTKCTCPHCGADMDPINMPYDSSWGGEIHYVCFNDQCCYYSDSWNVMEEQGVEETGYRCRMDPRGRSGAAPVWSPDALKDLIVKEEPPKVEQGTLDLFDAEDFKREDESPDIEFYKTAPLQDPPDSLALETIEDLLRRLVRPDTDVLDLIAGSDSHLGTESRCNSLTGLGFSEEELGGNQILTEKIIHDLNDDPTLPFEDNRFHAVINSMSVDRVTRPIEVFREVARVLKPRGFFIVVFSNRMFPPKAVEIWKRSSESERVDLVKDFFNKSERFAIDGYLESTGKPRPKDDKYYMMGIPSDPVYVVWGRAMK